MSRLVGLSSSVIRPVALTAVRPVDEVDGGPPAGLGVAYHEGRACRLFVDDAQQGDAALAAWLAQHPVRAATVVAHLGQARPHPRRTHGQPFVREWQGRQWSFVHRGALHNFRPRFSGSVLPVGNTDSERAFCWLLQQLRKRVRTRREPAWRQLAPLITELSDRIAVHGMFDFMLSDGEALYARAASSLYVLGRCPRFTAVEGAQDAPMPALGGPPGERLVVVATDPLSRDAGWELLEPDQLRVYVAGEEVWRSPARTPPDVVIPPGASRPLGSIVPA